MDQQEKELNEYLGAEEDLLNSKKPKVTTKQAETIDSSNLSKISDSNTLMCDNYIDQVNHSNSKTSQDKQDTKDRRASMKANRASFRASHDS